MKKLLGIIMLTSAVACSTKESCSCSHDDVCIDIKNETSQDIEEIKLTAEGHTIIQHKELSDGDETCLSFRSPGENSFKLEATLQSGEVVTSTEVYSEGGYKFNAIIKQNEISVETGRY